VVLFLTRGDGRCYRKTRLGHRLSYGGSNLSPTVEALVAAVAERT
jgi:hypothetical protein